MTDSRECDTKISEWTLDYLLDWLLSCLCWYKDFSYEIRELLSCKDTVTDIKSENYDNMTEKEWAEEMAK